MKLQLFTMLLGASLVLSLVLAIPAQEKRPVPGDPKRELHIFDVRDLITAADKPKREADNLEALRGFISTFIDPLLEKGDDVKSLGDGSLVVLGKPNQQAWVQRFLTQNRKAKPYFLSVAATFVHMGDKTFESELRPILKKESSAVIDDTEKSATFMAGLLKKADVAVVNAPRYLALPLQQASVWVGEKITYVSNYQIRKIDSPKGYVADPVVEEARDGILFEGTGAFVDKSFIGLDFKLVIAELHKPVQTEALTERKKDLPEAIRKLNLKVSLPETTKTTLKSKALVPNQGWAVFSLGRRHHKHWVLILKVEQIAEPK
jgi:hypothetical protein